MAEFMLIDLYAQHDEVVNFVTDMTEEEVLSWMGKYGTVTKIATPYDERSYSFHSNEGIVTAFRFNEQGNIVVFHK